MKDGLTIEEIIAARYPGLSQKLQQAADILVTNKFEVASRTLRAISAAYDLSPATLSRLARALGFDTYDDMRDVMRDDVGRQVDGMSDRVARLRATPAATVMDRQIAACMANIEDMRELNPHARMEQAVDLMLAARNVVLFGAFGSSGIVEYMAYLTNYFAPNWTLAGRRGASLGASVAGLGPQDVLFVVTTAPHAHRAVITAKAASDQGATVIVVTDSHTCPAVRHSTVSFFVPSQSPQFFSSYAATLVLMEGLIATLIARSPDDLTARIAEVDAGNRNLGEFWSET
jgi:DNA-binding MurR/RpiR family transcriptional regulator